MSRAIVAALAMALAGCGGRYANRFTYDYAFTVDAASFSTEEVDAIQRAMTRWNVFLARGRDTFRIAEVGEVEPDGEYQILRVASLPDGLQAFSNGTTHTIFALPELACHDVSVEGPACLELVMMHELGHQLGLGHLPSRTGIMSDDFTADFTQADRDACVASDRTCGVIYGRNTPL